MSDDFTDIIAQNAVEPLLCDVCSKNMRNMETGSVYIGEQIIFGFSPTESEFFSEQLGPYKMQRAYYVCWECRLKSLGVKP